MLAEPVEHPLPVIVEVLDAAGTTRPVPAGRIVHPHDLLLQTPKCVVHLALVRGGDVPISFTGKHEQRCIDPVREHDGRVIDVLLRLLPERGADAVLTDLGRRVVARGDLR